MLSTRRLGRGLLALLCGAVLLGLIPTTASTATLEEIKKRGSMVVATEDNYPPFEFVQDGQPAGLDHDLYKLLKDWAGFQVRQEILPWQGLLAGVVSGQFDVALSAATISDQRAQQLYFAMPIAEATHYYMKRKGDTRIQSIKDLSGLTAGMQQGSSIHQRLPEIDALLQKSGGKLGKVSLYASRQRSDRLRSQQRRGHRGRHPQAPERFRAGAGRGAGRLPCLGREARQQGAQRLPQPVLRGTAQER